MSAPAYLGNVGDFRAEAVIPFIGQKAAVAVTPNRGKGVVSEPDRVAVGVVAGAQMWPDNMASQSSDLWPAIYFEHGWLMRLNPNYPDARLTITLVS